ncbi:hypothetical protein [Nonomuraea sp. NPDC050643]
MRGALDDAPHRTISRAFLLGRAMEHDSPTLLFNPSLNPMTAQR